MILKFFTYELKKYFKCDINCISFGLFLLALIFMIYININYSDKPILEYHSFRQTQTALSSFYIEQYGLSFDYVTPVIGEPWSIPFEFPIYQDIVAIISRLMGFSLTQTGRIIGLFFAIITCAPIFLILNKLEISRRSIYFSLALFLSSPVYIFWSGTFMIESTALFFTCFSLYYALKIFQGNFNNINYIFFSFFLIAALLQKVTTALTPVIIIVVITIIYIEYFLKNKKQLIKFIISIAIPLLLAYLWIFYSDYIKSQNPLGKDLTSSNLTLWNFGSFDQRLSRDLWFDVIYKRNIATSTLYFFGIFSIILSLYFIKEKYIKLIITLLCILFILPFLIFTNLHVVHNYYQYANSIYLSVAVGLSTCYLCDKFLKNNKLIYTIILTTFISSNLLFFYKEYYPIRSSSISIENNRTLALAAYIKTNTPVNTPIVIYGYGWSSEVAFYSERKSLSLPEDKWYLEAIQNPSKFLKNPPSAYILCPVPGVNVLQGLIEEKYKVISNQKIYDCQVLIVNGWN